MPSLTSIYVGDQQRVKYNSKTRRVCPSDWHVVIFTTSIIVVPTFIAIYLIQTHESLQMAIKIIISVIVLVWMYMSLKSLYTCSMSDPGIIPSIINDRSIPDRQINKPNPHINHFVRYQTRNELDSTMHSLGVEDFAARYYHVNKFKYIGQNA